MSIRVWAVGWRAAVAGLFVLGTVFPCWRSASADEFSPEQVQFFEARVRPLLVQRCLECHDAKSHKSGLRLDSRAAMLKGGESGMAAVVPGHPEESLLIEAIHYTSYEMPPKEPLAADEIAILEKWVLDGAAWPGRDSERIRRRPGDTIRDEDRAWWAFQPVARVQVPLADTSGWATNEIDQFIYRKLLDEGLTPAGQADRTTLIRRLSFDLRGLPPTPEEVDAFVRDPSPHAYEALVDAFLESPRFGEHWARHWLDLVRYADSDGYRIDHYRPNAWRYRDYVIASFQEDKPYDRFVQEQLAGDELFPDDPQALIATGYLRHGIYEYNNRDVRGQWEIMLNDITDTTSDVFLGLGMQCARCHDHKFDPLLQRDYYRLRAFFAPMLPRDDLVAATHREKKQFQEASLEWERRTAALREELARLEAPFREKAAASAIEKFPLDIQALIHKPVRERSGVEHQLAELAYRQVTFEYTRLSYSGESKQRILELKKELSGLDKLRPAPLPQAMCVSDVGKEPPPTFLPGEPDEDILPGFPTILDPEAARIDRSAVKADSSGRRAALAQWIARPDNPVTTRVITNRVWQYLFGRPLAQNPSDFGRLGGEPSHPELLDWLTARFVEDGWSIKQLCRRIVTSSTYRASTSHPKFAFCQSIDPANRFYWRGDTERLSAEQIRDAILFVSGELDLRAGGEGVMADQPRRSIYTRSMRNARDPLLDIFDLPQFFSSTAERNRTTTPVQSLLLINSQTMLHHSQLFAQRVRRDVGTADGEIRQAWISRAWELAYGRRPSDDELQAALAFVADQEDRIRAEQSDLSTAKVATGQIPYRDGQSILLEPGSQQQRLFAATERRFASGAFTVEAYFQLRSIYETGSVRAIVAKWDGNPRHPGWSFGVTGKGSRRKPQTLVLQLYGQGNRGTLEEAAVFSDQHVQLNTPYYASATVHMATADNPGKIVFCLKDISNDDEPLRVVEMPHSIRGGFDNDEPLTIGGRSGKAEGSFDGLIDDIRISTSALPMDRLLYTTEGVHDTTLAYWQFEPEPGIFKDSSPGKTEILPFASRPEETDPRMGAFVDFCHMLLNSNEFLYVH